MDSAVCGGRGDVVFSCLFSLLSIEFIWFGFCIKICDWLAAERVRQMGCGSSVAGGVIVLQSLC